MAIALTFVKNYYLWSEYNESLLSFPLHRDKS